MTLENMLQKKFAEPPTGQPEVVIAHQGWTVSLRPEARDTLGCALDELRLERAGAPADGEPRPWAERISRTVTGLLEPLKLIEVDAPRKIALLRSAAPTPGDPGLRYYEVELHGSARATVRRYRGYQEIGHRREQIPFTLTHEALAKLIGDITAEK
jgi:hypothetical protein